MSDFTERLTRAHTGDEKAREELILENRPLVYAVVKRFEYRGYDREELFQIGMIGLMKAIDRFDTKYEVAFSTYAVPMIIGEIRRFLRDNNCIRVSRSVRDLAYKAMQARETLSSSGGREVTNAEIAKALNVSVSEVDNALEAVVDPVSIFEPVFRDGNDAVFVVDQISDASQSDVKWTEHLALRQALTKLDKREYNIINMRYFAGKTQMEIAEEIGISQAQVSRLEKSALERMKKFM